MDHKEYEKAIDGVGASFRRSQAVRDKRRLELIDQPHVAMVAPAGGRGGLGAIARTPKYFREIGAEAGAEREAGGDRIRRQEPQREGGREHLPPASSSLDTFTLLKFYTLTAPILQSVFRGLQDAEVGIHPPPHPQSWTILAIMDQLCLSLQSIMPWMHRCLITHTLLMYLRWTFPSRSARLNKRSSRGSQIHLHQ